MEQPRFRFSYDRSNRSFTEADWLNSAWDQFERLEGDSDLSFALFLISTFQDHIRSGKFSVAATKEEEAQAMREIESLYAHEGYLVNKIRRTTGDSGDWVVYIDPDTNPATSKMGRLVGDLADVRADIEFLNGARQKALESQ